MATPTFVVVGHVVRDIVPDGWRLGGTATYTSVQALRLGLSVGIVTRVADDVKLHEMLPGTAVAGGPSSASTTFQNVYERGKRKQSVLTHAAAITEDDIPKEWRVAPLALLGPVCGEVPPDMGCAFSGELVAAAAQGWLRDVDRRQRVRKRAWQGEPFWQGCNVLFVSDEDLGTRSDQLDRWCDEVPIVVMTLNRNGARVHSNGNWRDIDAFPAEEVDPTGAGDVFASAFLTRYHETNDLNDTMRFASAASACSIEAIGIEGIADRERIEARIAAHPEVTLR